MARLRPIALDMSLADRLAAGPGAGVSLYWLGQAGFVIDAHERRYVIDPYLSDTLADKYRSTPFSHARMMPAPLSPAELGVVDLVLCTHHHTDHMDGATLWSLGQRLPDLRFVVPVAARAIALDRIGVDAARLVEVDAGERLTFDGFTLDVLRAAHEMVEQDDDGRHRFLGYGLDLGGARLLHSGDTIPFDGQDDEVRAFAPDIALLPVNGRSDGLRSAGFAGNFTLSEAVALCKRCGIPTMIAHHFGMFAFNTIAVEEIDLASQYGPVSLVRAREGSEFRLDDA
ncbi:MAG: MBL fold metallo-hydrolase [Rhizobium sp.]|nr:MBL fold metallo-hydrolase [Rhizobium sp.]